MYFPDLTPYRYGADTAAPDGRALNVGWLAAGHTFPRGAVPDGFLDRLFALVRRPVNVTRGWHTCEFCPVGPPAVVERDGVSVPLGHSEIRVEGRDGVVYAAPDLVYHYVEAHRYVPPREFIDAVLRTGPASPPGPWGPAEC